MFGGKELSGRSVLEVRLVELRSSRWVPNDYRMELGKAHILREGGDVSIIAFCGGSCLFADLFERFGLTPENVAEQAKRLCE